MNVLIVEDNMNKLQNIVNSLHSISESFSITERHSFNSGLKAVMELNFDLIILDMSLPTFDITRTETGGDKKRLAGRNIMKRMAAKHMKIPTIVITQFETFDDGNISLDTLNAELSDSFPDMWIGSIYYGNNDWEVQLRKLVDSIWKDDKNDECTNR